MIMYSRMLLKRLHSDRTHGSCSVYNCISFLVLSVAKQNVVYTVAVNMFSIQCNLKNVDRLLQMTAKGCAKKRINF